MQKERSCPFGKRVSMKRERLGSRMGFIMLSAGCAIGCGNVWKFPRMYRRLEKPGQKWHLWGAVCLIGNIAIMAFYCVVTGWIIYYFVKFLTGQNASFGFASMIANPVINVVFLFVTVAVAFLILSRDIQKGLERITKYMMSALLVLMLVLAVHSALLDGAADGLIIFPACSTYGLEVNAGPSLLFDTMASVFNHMAGGRIWGTMFFLFMIFAALSTVLGVCENILAMVRELTGWSRPKGCIICGTGIFLLALTTALGYSVRGRHRLA